MSSPTYQFQILPALEEAWQKVKGAKLTFMLVVLTLVVTSIMIATLNSIPEGDNESLLMVKIVASLFAVAASIFQLMLTWSFVYLGIQRASGQPIFYSMIKNVLSFKLFFKMVGLYILTYLMIGLAMLLPAAGYVLTHYIAINLFTVILSALLSVAGGVLAVYLGIRIILSSAIILNEGKNPWTAMKISFAATRDNFWRVLGYFILLLLVLIASIIPLGIGMIWSIPFYGIAYGMIYRKMVMLRTVLDTVRS